MAVPKSMKQKYDEIALLIISFCDEKLNEEYKEICLRLLEKLCRKRPSPLVSGRARTWAAGIVYAIGANNFIFDKSQELNLTAAEIAEPFGISTSTAGNKAAEIRKHVKISFFTPEWLLKELTDSNPMTWMVEVNGLLADIRMLPITIQRQAYAKGLIPYVPGMENKNAEDILPDEAESSAEQSSLTTPGQAFEFLITLDMYDFEIWRKIVVPADITFKQLHFVVQSCFNWLSYHMYNFDIFDNSEESIHVAIITDDKDASKYVEEGMKIYPFSTKLTAFCQLFRSDWRCQSS